MNIYRRASHQVPGLNTAALPDLIFTVLFFFMIVTHMRKVELKVKYQVPAGTELSRLTKKSTVTYIYIGRGVGGSDTKMRVQLNDKLSEVSDIVDYIVEERKRMSPEDVGKMTVSIKADRQADMGLITDVKQALRQANALRINYSAVSEKR
ncbi:MAG: biopolymer transporter ExbD [Prevotella sp.]|uniref:ExbD/TolR family protein n=1 Tax=Prevotella sp. Rep29 TaxID=2691580 RepID=UPI001C6E6D10|nr:biopolymer transporter ExbD [Prevotella sp. Rep29]MBR3390384.1 biopolymer transporter ExbD [Prevotella sp.]MBR7014411.1 biopolymer transporter ExbD [Prevotella sp.]MBR7094042.1 biopolymer transporter ExbD [Prevotella sp.]QYR10175.1 biopolymer transporter ExbD [Prevotella sp. Rep29]